MFSDKELRLLAVYTDGEMAYLRELERRGISTVIWQKDAAEMRLRIAQEGERLAKEAEAAAKKKSETEEPKS